MNAAFTHESLKSTNKTADDVRFTAVDMQENMGALKSKGFSLQKEKETVKKRGPILIVFILAVAVIVTVVILLFNLI